MCVTAAAAVVVGSFVPRACTAAPSFDHHGSDPRCSLYIPSFLSRRRRLQGHTAWVGIKICQLKAGDTLVVSGAAGAVGSVAAQLGKIAGATVIGIAGGTTKCDYVTKELGMDGCIDCAYWHHTPPPAPLHRNPAHLHRRLCAFSGRALSSAAYAAGTGC